MYVDNVGCIFNPKATKSALLDLVDLNKKPPVYAATKIATKYGHLLFFTPPYHPTLQPIELIWGIIKGEIARSPAKNATDLIERVHEGLERNEDEWVRVFRHAQRAEDAYVAESLSNNME